ncbi:MAG: TonB family protein [Nitrospira sp.]|nr:TonB family protein [Nitrospira sp.]
MIRRRERLSGWATSVTVHAALIIAAAGLLTQMPPLQPQDFHLELVFSSPSEAQPGPDHSNSDTAPSGSQPVSSPPLNRPTREASPDLPAEPPLSTHAMDQGQQPAPPSHATAPPHGSTDAVLPRDVAQATAASPVETFHQIDNGSVETQPVPSIEPVHALTHSIVQESSPAETALADSLRADSLPSDRQDIASSDQARRDERPSDSSPPRSPNVSDSYDAEGQTDVNTLSHSTITPSVTRTALSKPNYGWLMELLRNRIMRLQAYPLLARQRGWEGIVVVRATIDRNGHLVNAVVTKSSGYGALDDDALGLMRRACPLPLTQDLNKPKITVVVPIRYRLNEFDR